MSNPSKAKGTGAETELLRILAAYAIHVHRTSPGMLWDLEREGPGYPFEALATRPDRGQWLVTLGVDQFAQLIQAADALVVEPVALRIESKRYKRFSLHSIFNQKFRP